MIGRKRTFSRPLGLFCFVLFLGSWEIPTLLASALGRLGSLYVGLGLGLQVPPPLGLTVRLHLAEGGHAELEIHAGLLMPRGVGTKSSAVFPPIRWRTKWALPTGDLVLRSSFLPGPSG